MTKGCYFTENSMQPQCRKLWGHLEAAKAEVKRLRASEEATQKLYKRWHDRALEAEAGWQSAIEDRARLLKQASDENEQLQAQCNTLRSALEGAKEYYYYDDGSLHMPEHIVEQTNEALAQTPEQSLEAYKDEVLEEVAKRFEKSAFRYLGPHIDFVVPSETGEVATRVCAEFVRSLKTGEG